jgi:predicted esterase
MKPQRCLWIFLLVASAMSASAAQEYAPAPSQPPDEATRKKIDAKMGKLADKISAIRSKNAEDKMLDTFLADVEVFHQAARRIVQHNEFFQKESAAWTLDSLDNGLNRIGQIERFLQPDPLGAAQRDKLTWLESFGTSVVRGYRSMVDGSVQPYAVSLPEEYGSTNKKWRVEIVLHGRDANLNEIKFQHQFNDKNVPADLDSIRIDIFGRGNNAYRWAGETDILEALNHFETIEKLAGRGKLLDRRRMVLRGFSMGGAGTWHLGLHRPGDWCVLGPGAGFTATHGYVKGLAADLGWPQEQMLRIYDAVAYAENAFDVPIVAYAGAKDPQLQAARNIEAALAGVTFPYSLKVLVAPDLEHEFPPEWQRKAQEAYEPFMRKGRDENPKRVRFVTYTLRYPSCDWVDILGLEKHYDRAMVDAEKTEDGLKVTTANINRLRLRVSKEELSETTISIDGQKVVARPWDYKTHEFHVFLEKRQGTWAATMPQRIAIEQFRNPRKMGGLQGPIDDAFTGPFLCVRATGQPWSEQLDDYATACLKRFQDEWSKYMRGDLPVKNDTDLTADDIANKNLILFGDPGSNSILANVLDGLPIQWTRESFTVAGKTFPAAECVPCMIFPNPLNPMRYVVLNSGHTFHAEDFKGTNALLYPHLGDYAVMRPNAKGPILQNERVELNGLFDDSWKVTAAPK